jgi:TolB-like protein/predicted Ser/Thr protein kinase
MPGQDVHRPWGRPARKVFLSRPAPFALQSATLSLRAPSAAAGLRRALIAGMTLPAGTRIGRYEVRSLLGAGGMGEVYLAQDTELHRPTALKILPAEVAQDARRMHRFKLEARAAAALNHPNIAHVYEVGEANGAHFIAMELIDGQTLRECMREGRADLPKLLRYLQHAAEGLAKAHAAGIVHRDLKPDNIMITRDGFAKVLDFGVAKLVEPQGPPGAAGDAVTVRMEQHSRPGVVLGTAGYMSPEQAQGKTDEIDQRSDIFSFGCILYEAATGRMAFSGSDAIDSLNKIIRETPAPLHAHRPDLPAELQKIVRRCLEKEPDERYQSIKDVAIELKELRRGMEAAAGGAGAPSAWGTAATRADTLHAPSQTGGQTAGTSADAPVGSTAGTSPPPQSYTTHPTGGGHLVSEIRQHKKAAAAVAVVVLLAVAAGVLGLRAYLREREADAAIESIAVLPFVNQNDDPETEYRSDGLTESIINSLAQIPNLRVIARSSVFRYKGRSVDPLAAGRELGVRAVLTGRVMQRGDDLAISTELLDVRENKQLWGEQYNERASNLMVVQRAIATEISGKLRLKLTGADETRVNKHYTDDPEAYQLYLKGRFQWNRRTPESLEKSVEYLNQAIERDPAYALAYAALADAWFSRGWYRFVVPKDAYERARAAAARALEIDPNLAEAHAILAAIKTTYEWDWQGAEREYRLAIQLNPNYANAHHRYSLFLPIAGRFDEAVAEAKRARDLDPLSLPINENVGDILYLARRYPEAEEQLRKTLELDPNYGVARGTLAKVYEAQGRYEEALDLRLAGAPADAAAEVRKIFAASGIKGVWRHWLDQRLERAKREYVSPADIALFYARLGERDEAFAWLERAMQERSILFNYLAADARFDNLRPDPRYAELLGRVGLRPLPAR